LDAFKNPLLRNPCLNSGEILVGMFPNCCNPFCIGFLNKLAPNNVSGSVTASTAKAAYGFSIPQVSDGIH
jgi:hypothetical protein